MGIGWGEGGDILWDCISGNLSSMYGTFSNKVKNTW